MHHKQLNRVQMRDLLAAHISNAGDVNSFSVLAGVKISHIEKVAAGDRDPCADLLRAIGLRTVPVYLPRLVPAQ